MLGLYIVTAIIGGVLVLVSAFAGDHGQDIDGGIDLSPNGDVAHADAHVDATWVPFLSLRFWTYFFAGFGLTGLLLSYISGATEIAVAVTSGVVGLVVGLAVAYAIRYLSNDEASANINTDDLLGQEAKVMVTVRHKQPGKVRIHHRGDTLDFLALAHEDTEMAVGEDVIIVAMEGGYARVLPRSVLFDATVGEVNA